MSLSREVINAITTIGYAVDGNQTGNEALSKVTNELDRLKQRETLLVHTLNNLHETVSNFYYSGYYDGVVSEIEEALDETSKILGE